MIVTVGSSIEKKEREIARKAAESPFDYYDTG